jgi:hypothetical protein
MKEIVVMQSFSRRDALRGAILAAAAALLPAGRALAGERVSLAIKGYDPVAYFKLGKPQRGRPDLEYEWDEHRYRFVSAAHRELFKADPMRYAPQFPNFCAMSLTKGEVVEADPENWLISEGKLYLFGKTVGPALFRQNLAENAARANQNRALIRKK